jgi:hypothetical protein
MKYLLKIIVQTAFLALLFFSCSKEDFQETGLGVVKGRVFEEDTFNPIANAKVSSSPNSSTVFTDSSGYFFMENVPVGTYSFQAQKDDYIAKFESGTVIADAIIELNFELKKVETTNTPPTIPILTSPIDNATNQPLSVNLTWTSSDVDVDDVLTYTITLRNDSNSNIQTFNDITTTSFNLTNLNYSTKYYWQVAVSDGENSPVFSAVSSFTTEVFPNARFLFTRIINGNNVIFIGNDTGNQLQITPESANSYRPKRNTQINRIAFIKTDGAQEHIYTMKPDGSDMLRITNSVPIAGFNMNYVCFSWSGNGSQIIYPNFDKLFRINADGSGLTQIYQVPTGRFISECEWSVDGSLIAIKTNDISGYTAEITLLDGSGNFISNLVTGVFGAIGSLHFSVNNQRLLYTRDISGFQSPDYRQLDTNIFVYNLLTNTSTMLNTSKPAGTNDIDVRYSPNEAEVIFMNTSNDGVSIKNIQRFNLSISNSRVTLFSNGFMPDWK